MNNKKSKTIFKNVIIYIMCTFLAGFYLFILWWGQNPDVCTEYRMYYITHELADWPGYNKLSYNLGTKEYCKRYGGREYSMIAHKFCKRKGQGWQKDIVQSCINKSDEAYIYYVPTESAKQGSFNVTINHFEGYGNVAVYADEVYIGAITGMGDYTFETKELKAGELLTIKFVAQECEFGWQVVSLE